MKEIKTWENETEESMTIEDEISDVLIDSADENAEQSDTITDIKNEDEKSDNSDETNENTNEPKEEDQGDSEDNSKEETDNSPSDELTVKPKRKLTRVQSTILIASGVILVLLLIWLLLSSIGVFRSGDVNYIGSDNSTVQTEPTDTENTDDQNSSNVTDQNQNSNNGVIDKGNGNNNNDQNSNGGKDDQKDQNNNTDDKNNSSDNGDTNKNDNNDNSDKDDTSDDQNKDDTNKDDSTVGDNTDKDSGNDAASDYSGEAKVRISTVNDDTGIITLTIDGNPITVPVQTTVFNGRVTKSGVAQGKLFGYSCGVTVLMYYQQSEGFGSSEVTGFMNRNEDGLTVLVDINDNGSKLLIKVNGMKSMF